MSGKRTSEDLGRDRAAIGEPIERLELATVLKVSQAVPGEMVLDGIVETLLRTAIEQAGAQRGLLILPQGEELLIQAEAETCGSSVTVCLRETPASAHELPESLVRYAARTRENVILDDALARNPFSSDEYIREKRPRSVLCLPLVKQGVLVALLYMENNLGPGSFSPHSIVVLKVLASQAAISLENGRLYRELQEREGRIRRLVDANIIGILISDSEGRIIESNDAFLKMVGYTREELGSGRVRWRDMTPAEWNEASERGVVQVRTTGACKAFEKEYYRKDGSRVPVLVGAARFEKSSIVAFALDLTELKRAEETLRRSQHYLAEAQKATHTGSWAWSTLSGQLLYWSEECYRISGFDPAQGLPSFEASFQRIHPEDQPVVAETIERAVREKAEFQIEFREVLPDSRGPNIRILAHPVLDPSGNLVEFVGTVMDITEQKRAEAEHREHLWFLESMDRINRAMQRTNDVELLMSGVVQEALAIFGCDRAWLVYPCDPGSPTVRAVMEHTRPEFPGAFGLGEQLPVDTQAAEALRRILESPGAATDLPLSSRMREQFSIQSMIASAVRPKGDRPYLFGLHQCSHARTWTAAESRLFEEIARRLEDALTNVLAHRSLLVSQEALQDLSRDLQESKIKLEEAQRVAHVGHWERDLATGRITWSDENYRIFGLEPQECPMDLLALQRLIHPEDQEGLSRAINEALAGVAPYNTEYRVVRRTGEVRVVHSTGDVKRDASGQPYKMFGVAQDITDRKRAEEERGEHVWFLESMDRINRAMQRTNDVEGMMSGVLEETLAIFGSDRALLVYPCDPDTATCLVVMEHSHPEYSGDFALGEEVPMERHSVEFVRRVLDSPCAAKDLNIAPEIRERFHIQSAIAIAVRPKGDRPYLFGVYQCSHARDWTAVECRLFEEIARRMEDALTSVLAHRELMVSEEELRRSREKLAQASKIASLAELSASIAHEINQPLQAIMANAHASLRWLAAMPPDVDKASRTADRIVRDGHAAADVVNRIRALFKRANPVQVYLDINELILQASSLMADEIQGKGMSLETELGEDVPRIRADAVQIQQVIANLVRNGIEAMATTTERPKSLRIQSRREGVNVVVDVQDHGVGLVDSEKIFEPFVTTKETGLGMGLAICRSIIESHAGRIWAARNPQRGVTFSFSLPIENSVTG